MAGGIATCYSKPTVKIDRSGGVDCATFRVHFRDGNGERPPLYSNLTAAHGVARDRVAMRWTEITDAADMLML